MSQFFGIVRHEFNMSIRRPGFWIAYGLLSLFYVISILTPSMDGSDDIIQPEQIWPEAGHIVFMFNIFLPLLAGILSADRMQRDIRLGVRELQHSTSLSTPGAVGRGGRSFRRADLGNLGLTACAVSCSHGCSGFP